jgi:N-acetylglucosamine malate deacetylase 1
MSKILFISSHVDDADLMCGGTIAKLVEQKNEVRVLTLSCKYEGVNLTNEWVASMDSLGVQQYDKQDFPTRLFYSHKNEILQLLYHYSGFDYIFIPMPDLHSDHSVVSNQAQRAFKTENLIGYMPEWNARRITKNYFVKLEHRHVQKKLEALGCYKSQQHRNYFRQDVIVGAMHVNGMMVNTEFAEAFQVVNLIA